VATQYTRATRPVLITIAHDKARPFTFATKALTYGANSAPDDTKCARASGGGPASLNTLRVPKVSSVQVTRPRPLALSPST